MLEIYGIFSPTQPLHSRMKQGSNEVSITSLTNIGFSLCRMINASINYANQGRGMSFVTFMASGVISLASTSQSTTPLSKSIPTGGGRRNQGQVAERVYG